MREATFIGPGGRSPLDGLIGRSGVTAGTTYRYPDAGINAVVNLSQTGMDDLTPKAASIDGMCWIAERDNGDQHVFTLAWNEQNEPYVRDCQLFATASVAEPIIQTGRDWILTRKFFLACHNETGMVYRLQVRDYPLRFSDGTVVPPEIGHNVGLSVRRESDWLYHSGEDREKTEQEQTVKNPPPYWERLNPVIGGYTILHDYLVPRQDYGRQLYMRGSAEGRDWSRIAIPYFLEEPAMGPEDRPFEYRDLWLPYWMGRWHYMNWRYAERNNMCPYAVFVIDGEIYVRTMNYLGTGRFMSNHIRLGPNGVTPYRESYSLLNMADLGIWRKNYQLRNDPDKNFDWNNSCMGKIGETLVLFECAEADYDPLTLGPMRIAATGRYIPIIGKVAYEDNPDGTVEANSPPMKWLTDAEAEELMVSLSIVTKTEDNKAYGFTPEPKESDPPKPDTEYMLRAYQLDENGDEHEPDETRPAYKGVRNHFAVGGNPITGAMGPYVFCNDDAHVFMTDTTGDLQRFVREGRIRPVALRQIEMFNPDLTAPNDLLQEDMFMFNGRRGAIDISYGSRSESEIPLIPMCEYEWEQKSIEPYTYRLLQSVIGEDVLDGALPAWNLPVLVRVAGRITAVDQQTLTYAWINPETGEVSAPITRTFPENERFAFYVSLNRETGEQRVCLHIYAPGGTTNYLEDIDVPSYLDGWTGITESLWCDPGWITEGVISNNAWPLYQERMQGSRLYSLIRHAPTLEPFERLYLGHRYWNTTPIGGLNGAYTQRGFNPRDLPLQHWNHDTSNLLFLSFWDDSFVAGLVADGLVYISNPEIQNYGTPARSHHINYQAYGDGNLVSVEGVFMAHYVKDKFLMEPTRWRDAAGTQPVEQYRYEKELIVMKCRRGESEQMWSAFPGSPYNWSQHRYIAYRADTDPEEYKRIIKPLVLRDFRFSDSDFVA